MKASLGSQEPSLFFTGCQSALSSRCYLWVEAMQTIHISKGHSQGGIRQAVPPSAELCVTHGGDRLVWGAALKCSLGRGVLFVPE